MSFSKGYILRVFGVLEVSLQSLTYHNSLIIQDSFNPFMNGPNWPKPHLNRANQSLKILNRDPKDSIHLIRPSFKIFKKFAFIYHP